MAKLTPSTGDTLRSFQPRTSLTVSLSVTPMWTQRSTSDPN